jgi:hypothetical protein
MKLDLCKEISLCKGMSNVFILTHNIDFIFLQNLALPALRKAGAVRVTVLADAGCASESFETQRNLVEGLGTGYRVVSIHPRPGFRFHPKAVLLTGPTEGTLFVGSGNLTFGGWRENAEIWHRLDASQDGSEAFHEFRAYLEELLESVPLAAGVESEVADAFDPVTMSWLAQRDLSAPRRLIARAGYGQSLIDTMSQLAGDDPTDQLYVCSPYFDRDGQALSEVIEKFRPANTTLLYHPTGSTLTRQAYEHNADQIRIQQVEHCQVDSDDVDEKHIAFIHAKFYALVRGVDVLVFAGSANCSRAALTIGTNAGNSELMTLVRMSVEEFRREWLGEFTEVERALELPDKREMEVDESIQPSLLILAARWEDDALRLAFSPASADAVRCWVASGAGNEMLVENEPPSDGVLIARGLPNPRVVRLRAVVNGNQVISGHAWVDHEHQLGPVQGRSPMIQTIRDRLRPEGLTGSGWTALVDGFLKHLTDHRYQGSARRSVPAANRQIGAPPRPMTLDEMFPQSYAAPTINERIFSLDLDPGANELSLQALLLRRFGVEASVEGANDDDDDDDDDGSDDERVDREHRIGRIAKAKKRKNATVPRRLSDARNKVDSVKAMALLLKILNAFKSQDYAQHRQLSAITVDVTLAAALVCLAWREGWIEEATFLGTTGELWSILFLDGGESSSYLGLIENRLRLSEDTASAVKLLQAPEVMGFLLGWVVAVSPFHRSEAAARCHMTAVLAAVRLPWLWTGGDDDAVGVSLHTFLVSAVRRYSNHDPWKLEFVRNAWTRLLTRGEALMRLQAAATAAGGPAVLNQRISVRDLERGEMLWQGKHGYCIVETLSAGQVDAWRVRDWHRLEFNPQMAISVASMLTPSVLPDLTLESHLRSDLQALVEELRACLHEVRPVLTI